MSSLPLIERVKRLEEELSALKAKISGREDREPAPDYLKFVGMFHGDKHFKSAMKLGAAYRASLRPKPRRKKAPRK